MMKRPMLLFTLFIIHFAFHIVLFAQNNMEQIAYMEGEDPGDFFGVTMASMDFNGDGYDDLVVASRYYQDKGKIYFYLGGPDFDDQADFTYTGDLPSLLGGCMTNLGDINGDGCEDLGFTYLDIDSLYVKIILGNTVQDTISDFVWGRNRDECFTHTIRPLGDINNDGYDDVGIAWKHDSLFDPERLIEFHILWGASEISQPEHLFTRGSVIYGFSGVGDVNNDGFDDFCVGYCDSLYTSNLFFGGTEIDTTTYVCLWQAPATNMTLGLPAGDINNDGYDDFGCYFSWDPHIWLGGENITQNYLLTILYGNGGGTQDFGFSHGDVNNDGYSDLILGSPSSIGDDGEAFLYLGGPNPNNTFDVYFPPLQIVNHRYGSATAIGDFNADQYDDVAISGPAAWGAPSNHGYVYVFAGNGNLQDLVGADNHEVPDARGVILQAYPNPFNPTVSFDVKFSSEQNHQYEQMLIEIFNVKGQKVKQFEISNVNFEMNEIVWNAEDQTSGVYYCKLVNGKTKSVLSTKKITLLK